MAGHFELWLSRVAEDQPDLSHAENLASRAQFAAASGIVASVVAEAEEEAIGEVNRSGRFSLPEVKGVSSELMDLVVPS